MFTVQANGSDLTYQWQRNGMNLTDGTKYSGSTTASLSVMAVMREDEGNFTCVITNAVDSITSNSAELTLCKQQYILRCCKCAWCMYVSVHVHVFVCTCGIHTSVLPLPLQWTLLQSSQIHWTSSVSFPVIM